MFKCLVRAVRKRRAAALGLATTAAAAATSSALLALALALAAAAVLVLAALALGQLATTLSAVLGLRLCGSAGLKHGLTAGLVLSGRSGRSGRSASGMSGSASGMSGRGREVLESFRAANRSRGVGHTATAVRRLAALLEGGHGFLIRAAMLGGVSLALRNPFL
jgi:hypothetical protein